MRIVLYAVLFGPVMGMWIPYALIAARNPTRLNVGRTIAHAGVATAVAAVALADTVSARDLALIGGPLLLVSWVFCVVHALATLRPDSARPQRAAQIRSFHESPRATEVRRRR